MQIEVPRSILPGIKPHCRGNGGTAGPALLSAARDGSSQKNPVIEIELPPRYWFAFRCGGCIDFSGRFARGNVLERMSIRCALHYLLYLQEQ